MNINDLKVCKARIYQSREPLKDIPGKVNEILSPVKAKIKSGDEIAVAVGSRGISNIDRITKTTVEVLKSYGARPFVVPAMGSHGGATAQGQTAVLASYGITKETVGVEIRSSMETVYLGDIESPKRVPVYMDKHAYSAKGIVVINRVKVHTDFHGPHESGIVKMLVIGLGKQAQAEAIHRYGANGLRDLIPDATKKVIETGKILAGIASLEDGQENTADLIYSEPEDFFQVDHDTLIRCRELMAKLPFDRIDLLLVDLMGKEISGTGMDTNVIGRIRIEGQENKKPDCHRIVVLDLTEKSHGNALGIGLADITTRRLADKIDWDITNANVIPSGNRCLCKI